jgi:uncharacterized protein (TIGR03437 family)
LNGNQTPVLQSSAAPGLPPTLNQTSLSVKVNSVTTAPALYYASNAAVAAVLPSGTPVGMGTLTATYNGNSTTAPIQVVPSAIDLDSLYGSGAGAGVVTDSNFNVLDLTNSALPGEAITLWGSGVGADTSNDESSVEPADAAERRRAGEHALLEPNPPESRRRARSKAR